ncbi:hypothetical protein HW450_06645 [Corynebacterium hindlerae]|uniref:Uncharacterized protein n=1 Tax=Corynebacterium hindlerae TaxID=699041 RepID=A0A7G5FIC7_9CORY|nr:hypothetical protein [Corynebacterium hindlerae]QMV86368.1 hypothetical protein HW450_06645 [Corynebacterium hindlerae]
MLKRLILKWLAPEIAKATQTNMRALAAVTAAQVNIEYAQARLNEAMRKAKQSQIFSEEAQRLMNEGESK